MATTDPPAQAHTMKHVLMTAALLFALGSAGCQTRPGLAEFTSDGCSLFPDGTVQDRQLWCDCCFVHDQAYWRGGTETQRLEADQALRACVLARTGNTALADAMFQGVRAGGHPIFPTWYRWAYGWPYGRGYQTLSRDESAQADALFARYRAQHPDGFCQRP